MYSDGKREQKFLINLVEECSLERKQNSLRYFAAIYIFNQTGSGWIDKTLFVPFIADKFQVTQKTVENNLNKLHTLKWGNNTPDRFYYRSQEFVLSLMHPHSPSVKAVWISIDDLSGTAMDFRAFCHECTLAGRSRGGVITIARDTIHDQLNGHSKQTQRKYENLRGIDPTFNFGKLDGDDPLELMYKVNQPVFPVLPEDPNEDLFYVRQLPNSYIPRIKIGIRKRKRTYDDKYIQQSNASVKRYFREDDKMVNAKGYGYLETGASIMSGVLWEEIYLE